MIAIWNIPYFRHAAARFVSCGNNMTLLLQTSIGLLSCLHNWKRFTLEDFLPASSNCFRNQSFLLSCGFSLIAFIISTYNLSIFLPFAEQATDYKSAAAGDFLLALVTNFSNSHSFLLSCGFSLIPIIYLFFLLLPSKPPITNRRQRGILPISLHIFNHCNTISYRSLE